MTQFKDSMLRQTIPLRRPSLPPPVGDAAAIRTDSTAVDERDELVFDEE